MKDPELEEIAAVFKMVEDNVKLVKAEAKARERERQGEGSLDEQAARAKLEMALGLSPGSTWADLKGFIDPIVWDWPGWLPRGFLTILAAEPGMGKSMLCLQVAASYLAGRAWPDGTPFKGRRGRVVWCEGEASQALNMARAEAWGLKLADIVSPLPHPMTAFRLDDEKHMEALLRVCQEPETRLVVMDSLSSLVVGGAKKLALPQALYFLTEVARISKRPVLLTHHLRKQTRLDEANGSTISRVRGTSRIVQAARVVWTLDAPDLLDGENRRLMVAKNNLGRAGEAIGMRIEGWGLVFGAAPVAGGAEGGMVSQFDRAVELLDGLLEAGPVRVTEVVAVFLEAGVSVRTLRRVKKRLGVVSYRAVGEEGWWWRKGRG